MSFSHRDLWDTAHVNAALVRRAVSEGKAFFYFIAIMAFDWMQFTLIRLAPGTALHAWDYADALFTLALTIGGLVFLFQRNGGRHGRDFIYRYFPLSLVVGWKFLAAAIVALWLIDITGDDAAVTGWASVATLAAINVTMFARIGQHMRYVATHATRSKGRPR